MEYPKIKIDLEKFRKNCEVIIKECKANNISVTGIMKSFCAKPEIAQIMVESGIDYLGDARLYNLKKVKHLKVEKVLIRIPMKSTARDVVIFSDISLNSELEVIRELDKHARENNKIHKVILMVELGDLREGILEKDIIDVAREVLKLENIKLYGLGVNLTCYGAVIPTTDNLGKLVEISEKIEKELDIKLEMISGGNSSSYHLVENKTIPKRINNLRIGEAIVLGRETAYGERIKGTHDDIFVLKGEIVEIKEKKSVPSGKIGLDSFGNIPFYEDLGEIKRAIIAVGKQDTEMSGMFPFDEKIYSLGMSSDHLIMNITNSAVKYKIGDIVKFRLNYEALLKLMTSEYINKEYIDGRLIKIEFCNY